MRSYEPASLEHQLDSAYAEIQRLTELTMSYENAVTWNTTCTNCAGLLDRMYEATTQRDWLLAEAPAELRARFLAR